MGRDFHVYPTPKPGSGSGSDIEDVDTHIHLQMQTLFLSSSQIWPLKIDQLLLRISERNTLGFTGLPLPYHRC